MASLKQSKLFDIVKQMPPLRHSAPGCPFDIKNSEVVKWMVSNPKMLQRLFDLAKGTGAIVYDPDTGTWRGCDYAD